MPRGRFPGNLRGLCRVKVNLTMGLAEPDCLIKVVLTPARALSPGCRLRFVYTGGVKQFGHRAGRGGDVIPAPGREKIGKTRQSVLSTLPFSFDAAWKFLLGNLVSRTRCDTQ
jgi:hypothetical protein